MKPQSGRLAPWDRPYFLHILAAVLLAALGTTFLVLGVTPTHDTIGAYGLYHLYFDWMARGVPPYWNPYSQTGTPFYPYWQAMGLADPLTYAFVLVQKITGCGTLATFLSHYLFQYFILVVGSYHAFRMVTEDHRTSVFFSLILMLSVFPVVMHQVVMLIPFYLWPFITWAFLNFFRARPERKGPWLFVLVSFCAIACLTYIPSYLIFYVLFFIVFAVIFKVANAGQILAMVRSRRGLFWIAASVTVAGLVLAPVAALALEMRNAELFPFCRILLHHELRVPVFFAADAASNLFSEQTETWVSITLANLVGLVFQPQKWFMGLELWRSEVSLYVGLPPLACVIFLMRRRFWTPSDGIGRLMLAMTAVIALVMCSFGGMLDRGLIQRFLVAVVPTMRKVETFEVFGNPFLFCLLATGALGYSRAKRQAGSVFWAAALVVAAVKFLWYASVPGFHIGRYAFGGVGLPAASLVVVGFMLAGFSWIEIAEERSRAGRRRTACVVLTLADMVWFNVAHIQAFNAQSVGESEVVETKLYDTLKKAGLLPPKREQVFSDYREPLSQYCVYSMVGWEILSATKVAMPAVFNRYLSGCADLDGGFSTRRYYDYLAHVDLSRQLISSSIKAPILNFFSLREAISEPDERAAIAAINRESPRRLGSRIFIETGDDSPVVPQPLVEPKKTVYLEPTREQMLALFQTTRKISPREGFHVKILAYDVNRLFLEMTAPEDGYLYFGDGYSVHWRASVDGVPSSILKTNVNFKSVRVGKGRHRVEFVYDPRLIRAGLWLGVIGDILAAGGLAAVFIT